MDARSLSANWKRLQASLKSEEPKPPQSQTNGVKRKRAPDVARSRQSTRPNKTRRKTMEPQKNVEANIDTQGSQNSRDVVSILRAKNHINAGFSADVEVSKYLAIDCEMVGVGPPPHLESVLARVSIVNYNGDQVYDSFVLPTETVTDWRTPVSGVTPKHMQEARSFKEVQNRVAEILKGKILVGHALRHDFQALLLDHPQRDTRDTARHPPYRDLAGGGSPKLKILTSQLLGVEIQAGEHSSIEDARACMLLFRRDKHSFEREHARKWPTRDTQQRTTDSNATSKPRKANKKKRKKKR